MLVWIELRCLTYIASHVNYGGPCARLDAYRRISHHFTLCCSVVRCRQWRVAGLRNSLNYSHYTIIMGLAKQPTVRNSAVQLGAGVRCHWMGMESLFYLLLIAEKLGLLQNEDFNCVILKTIHMSLSVSFFVYNIQLLYNCSIQYA